MNSEQMTIKEVKGEGYEGNERVFNFHHRYIHFALEIEFDEHFWIFTSFFFLKFAFSSDKFIFRYSSKIKINLHCSLET